MHALWATVHAPQSRKPPHPSFVEPHWTLRSSHDFGMHGGVELVLSVPAATQRFFTGSHSRSDGHGHVFCERSMASTPHAASANKTIAKMRAGCKSVPSSQPRDFARSIWK
jgi:hypothetical protein